MSRSSSSVSSDNLSNLQTHDWGKLKYRTWKSRGTSGSKNAAKLFGGSRTGWLECSLGQLRLVAWVSHSLPHLLWSSWTEVGVRLLTSKRKIGYAVSVSRTQYK